jgi:hypothetical protein
MKEKELLSELSTKREVPKDKVDVKDNKDSKENVDNKNA